MSEFLSRPNPEFEREAALEGIIEQYFPVDKEFLNGMDFEDALSCVYGQLLDMGEDPDEVLGEFGAIE